MLFHCYQDVANTLTGRYRLLVVLVHTYVYKHIYTRGSAVHAHLDAVYADAVDRINWPERGLANVRGQFTRARGHAVTSRPGQHLATSWPAAGQTARQTEPSPRQARLG